MVRVIALALSLMLSLGAIIPLATNYSEAAKQKRHRKHQKSGWVGVRKYSKRWWELYHRQENRKKALAARKRALQERQEMLASQQSENGSNDSFVDVSMNKPGKNRQALLKENSASAILPSGENAPSSWKRGQSNGSEMQFRVEDGGKEIGSASISVVGPATGNDNNVGRNKTLGGVSTSALRRTVIDRMMKENGWVVNDYQKDVNGKQVFVVVAQSKDGAGQLQSRLFYFTEVEGKIYSLATNAPNETSERLAAESEKVINSLQRGNNSRPTQAAELR